MGPQNPVDSFEASLNELKKSPPHIVRLALETLQTPKQVGSEISATPVEPDPRITKLFDQITSERVDLWAQEQGYDSALDLVEKQLESHLWNSIEEPVFLSREYDSLESLIHVSALSPTKIFSFSAKEELLEESFLQDLWQEGEKEPGSELTYL